MCFINYHLTKDDITGNTMHGILSAKKKEKKLIMVNCQKGGKLASANGYGV